MKKTLIFMLVATVILLPFAMAEWVQPLDCTDLHSKVFTSKTEFTAPADICFYGTGYDGADVNVTLTGLTDFSRMAPVSNGVLTSIPRDSKISNVGPGVYRMQAIVSGRVIEYPLDIVVKKANNEIPEFSTVTAGIVLAICSIYLMMRRRAD